MTNPMTLPEKSKWVIELSDRKIRVQGEDLESAVKSWGKHQRDGTEVSCGILVRVREVGEKIYGYWDSRKFMECLD